MPQTFEEPTHNRATDDLFTWTTSGTEAIFFLGMGKAPKDTKAAKKSKQKGQDKTVAPPPPAKEPDAVDPPILENSPSPPPPAVAITSESGAIVSNEESQQAVPGMYVSALIYTT
ncbi:hypothetical protein DAEQUDRAFT_768384 [Daedalea quercina L-15889]|uniref:Uncharacterized protein n=1 Tax=Daedalea quercina L-15889 TaxID=1314783 RepID=A0A165MRF2_9APHY|nr:hypothetical protein DAEQUDRAFT_768384 [Daedalea quercina L-15889]